MCMKYFEGDLKTVDGIDLGGWRKGRDLSPLVTDLIDAVGSFDYASSLHRIWLEVVDSANRYIQETEPFKLARTDLERCREVLINVAEWFRITAILIKPFLPRTAETFYQAFNFSEFQPWESVGYRDVARPLSGIALRVTAEIVGGKPVPLFPKVELK